jgi:hypothetical protein
MKTKINIFIAFLLALVLTVSSFGPASAKGADCLVDASETNPTVGMEVEFSVNTSLPGPVVWDFANGVSSLETSPKYAFPSIGVYIVMARIRYDRYGDTWCTKTITVKPGSPVISSPVIVPPNSTTAIQPGLGTSASNNTTGNSNTNPSINVTDSNNVTIEVGGQLSQQAVVAPKTTATNGFWLFVQMAISPFVILNDYIIQNK